MPQIKTYIILFMLIISITSHAQIRKISLSAQNAPIKTVLAEIQQKSGYRILYNDEVVPDEWKISINVSDLSVKETLETLLKNTELIYIVRSEDLIVITNRKFQNQTTEITGTVTDEKGIFIPYANAVLYEKTDTLHLKQGAITNEKGEYKLVNIPDGNYRLKISYLGYVSAYKEITVSAQSSKLISQNFTLKSDEKLLQEVTVEGERPLLQAKEGKLTYYVPTLLKNKHVTNAYDALKEVPGVMEQGEVLSLVGTSGTTILLNGQKSSMTYDQIINLLKTIPVSRLENIEIMYSAPPQYNIRGATLNVVLKQTQEAAELQNTWQGETAITLTKQTHPTAKGRANVLYTGKNTIIDMLYSYSYFKTYNSEKMTAEHQLKDQIYEINQLSEGNNTFKAHNVRLGINHTFNNKDKMEVSYYGVFDQSRSQRTARTVIDGAETGTITGSNGPSKLHNVKIDYSAHFGLNAGAEYAYYQDNTAYSLINTLSESGIQTDKIISVSRQQINRTFVYANQTHKLPENWKINYGFNGSLTNTDNFSDAVRNGTVYQSASFNNYQRETIWNVFGELSKSFNEQLSLQTSFSAEHYKATEKSSEKETELCNNWAFFPTLNINYTLSANHIFQFSISSDKTYPSYWSLNPSVYHFSAYGITYGNPHLKPSRNYDVSLTYIFNQKYVIRPYVSHITNYYVQLPYQSPDKLQQEFMEQNFNFKRTIGLLSVIPFKAGKRISSKLTLVGFLNREKDDNFFNLSFDRKKLFGYANLNTDIVLSSQNPNLIMNVSGYYASSAIQGVFDLTPSGNLSSALTWTFDKNRAKFILKADDMLNTRTPFASINYQGQKNTLDAFRDTRYVSLSFIYNFGGFKEKERKEVDTSRFGTK